MPRYYEITPPTKYRAGFAGTEPNRTELFFDCSECGAKEPEIKGFLAEGPNFNQICVKKLPNGFFDLCMYCTPCFDKRIAETIAA